MALDIFIRSKIFHLILFFISKFFVFVRILKYLKYLSNDKILITVKVEKPYEPPLAATKEPYHIKDTKDIEKIFFKDF